MISTPLDPMLTDSNALRIEVAWGRRVAFGHVAVIPTSLLGPNIYLWIIAMSLKETMG